MFVEIILLRAGIAGCALSALLYLLALFARPPRIRVTGTAILLAAWGLISLALVWRIGEAGRLPFQSRYDLLLWFLWWLVLTYLFVESRTHVTLPGVLIAGLATALGAGGLLRMDSSVWPLLPQQDNIWFVLHALALYGSYAPLAVAVAIELSSPLYGPLIRHETQARAERLERYLEFRGYAYRLVLSAFPFLSLALISNALWRSSTRGHYWAWGAEETWAFIAWLLFACYLHLRTQVRTSRALTIAVSVAGAVAIALTFFGVAWLVGKA